MTTKSPVPSLFRTARKRTHIDVQGLNGRVVHPIATTDEEHDVFLVGRFQHLADARRGCGLGGDINEVDLAQLLGIGVAHQCVERGLCDLREQHLATLRPADLEDAWVMALPEPYRSDCEQALARRRGRVSVSMPEAGGEDAAAMAQVMARSGELCAAWGQSLQDGVIDPLERDAMLSASDGVIAAVLRFRGHLLQGVKGA